MPTDDFNLSRFIDAQQQSYASALAELKRGRKESHWIWYILPQLKGLGRSHFSQLYGISDLTEARAYVAHPVLGPRLIECIETLMNHREASAEAMLGAVDALKFRSCLTLFSQAAPSVSLFTTALDQFFAGQPDPKTISLLQAEADETRADSGKLL